MKTTSANYDTLNTGNKDPVGIVELRTKSAVATNAKYSSQTFTDIGSAGHAKYLRKMSMKTDKLDVVSNPLIGATTIEAEILDESLHVTDKLDNNSIVGMDAKIGFQGLAYADFTDLPTQTIINTQLVDDLAWKFSTKDARRIFTGSIFKNLISIDLDGAITDSATTATVSSASDLLDPANFSTGQGNLGDWLYLGLNIEGERMQHTATSGADLTVVRGIQGTTGVAHDDLATASQYLYNTTLGVISGFPFTWADMLLFILLTTEDGSGHAYYDLYNLDANFAGFGLGLTSTDVDIATIEQLGWKMNPWQRTAQDNFWLIEGEENAGDWITKNILIPNGLIAHQNESGQITVKSMDYIHLSETFSAVGTLDNDDIVSAELTIADDQLRNAMEFRPIRPNQVYGISWKSSLDASVTAYGQTERLLIDVPAESDLEPSGLPEDEWIVTRWMYLFGNKPGYVRIQTTFENWIFEVGDFVILTWDKFPDLKAGTRGWTTEKALIIGQEVTWDFGDINTDPSCECYFDCFCWEIFDKVGSFYTLVDTIEEGDITDTAVTLSATLTLADPPEAADGHHDFSVQVTASDIWMATLRITPPASGSEEHTITVRVQATEDVASTYTNRGQRDVIIRYNSGDSATTIPIMWAIGADDDCDRVYVHWYAASAGGGAGADAYPTVELIQVDYYTLDQALTLS